MSEAIHETVQDFLYLPFEATTSNISELAKLCGKYAYSPHELDFVENVALSALGIKQLGGVEPLGDGSLSAQSFEYLIALQLGRPEIRRVVNVILKMREHIALHELHGSYSEVIAGADEIHKRIYAEDALCNLVRAIKSRREHEIERAHIKICANVDKRRADAHALAFEHAALTLSARFSETGEWHDYNKTSHLGHGSQALHQLVQRQVKCSAVETALFWYRHHYNEILDRFT